MSRTHRKRFEECWVESYKDTDPIIAKYFAKNNNKFRQQEIAKFYSRTVNYYMSTKSSKPRVYRKYTNRKRTAFDKQALFKELNILNYDAVYDPWNMKTSDPDWWD